MLNIRVVIYRVYFLQIIPTLLEQFNIFSCMVETFSIFATIKTTITSLHFYTTSQT